MDINQYPAGLLSVLERNDDPDRPDGPWWEDMELAVKVYNRHYGTSFDPPKVVSDYVEAQNRKARR